MLIIQPRVLVLQTRVECDDKIRRIQFHLSLLLVCDSSGILKLRAFLRL